MARKALFAVALMALAACASPNGAHLRTTTSKGIPAAEPTAEPTNEAPAPHLESPGTFTLRYDGEELALAPNTWCYVRGCVDGVTPNPKDIGSPSEVRVHVPIAGWDLSATFIHGSDRCGRHQVVELSPDGDGWFTLRPAGIAGHYTVDLFASGTGDMVARFQWTTPSDGRLPTPSTRLALIADHDGTPDSYGVELELDNLATTPSAATAHLTVTAANGRSYSFDATRAGGCWPEGTVYFDGPDADGKISAALGNAPFSYDVTVTLDGTAYHASAEYPSDVIDGNEPSVRLRFTPALPAMH